MGKIQFFIQAIWESLSEISDAGDTEFFKRFLPFLVVQHASIGWKALRDTARKISINNTITPLIFAPSIAINIHVWIDLFKKNSKIGDLASFPEIGPSHAAWLEPRFWAKLNGHSWNFHGWVFQESFWDMLRKLASKGLVFYSRVIFLHLPFRKIC